MTHPCGVLGFWGFDGLPRSKQGEIECFTSRARSTSGRVAGSRSAWRCWWRRRRGRGLGAGASPWGGRPRPDSRTGWVCIEDTSRVADLPFEDKEKALKAHLDGVWVNAQLGDYIDAVDTVSKWCLSQIVARDDNQVMVRFDGWSFRWDATCRWTSYKIAPFRRCSKGYTGQVKMPLRAHLSFKVEEAQQFRERVDKLVEDDFRGLSAHELTQFIRGELFVYVEYLRSQGEYS